MQEQLLMRGGHGPRVVLGIVALALQFSLACGPRSGPFPGPVLSNRVDGTVVGVDNRSLEDEMASGVRVTIAPEGRPHVVVDLAPGWYLNKKGLHFSERDRLSVEGTSRAGDPVVLASRVTQGATSVALRDAQGRPLWEGSDAGPSSP